MADLITQDVLGSYYKLMSEEKRIKNNRMPIRQQLIEMACSEARVEEGVYRLDFRILEATRFRRDLVIQEFGKEFYHHLLSRLPKTRTEYLSVKKSGEIRRSGKTRQIQ